MENNKELKEKELNNTTIDQEATAEEIMAFIQNPDSADKSIKSKPLSSKELGLDSKDLNTLKEIASFSSVSINDENKDTIDKIDSNDDTINQEEIKKNLEILSKDPTLDFQNLFEEDKQVLKPYLKNLDEVTITDSEKERYLRCVLENTIFRTSIRSNKTGIVYKLKSKTMEEQEFISNKLREFSLEMIDDPYRKDAEGFPLKVLKHTDADFLKFITKINLIFALESINGKDVFQTQDYLSGDKSIDEFFKDALNYFTNLPDFIWLRLINVMRIFEKKENLLSTFILSEDF